MRCVDHPVKLAALDGERREDAVKHAQMAPSDEALVDSLVWPLVLWRIAPAQTVTDHQDDARDYPPAIDQRHESREHSVRLYLAEFIVRQQNTSVMTGSSDRKRINSWPSCESI